MSASKAIRGFVQYGRAIRAAARAAGPREYVVWWTTSADCDAIGDGLPAWCPTYLHREWASRRGRNGRGRLWVSEALDGAPSSMHRAVLDDAQPTALELWTENAAGIVMLASDVRTLEHLPGLVTDMFYRRWPA